MNASFKMTCFHLVGWLTVSWVHFYNTSQEITDFYLKMNIMRTIFLARFSRFNQSNILFARLTSARPVGSHLLECDAYIHCYKNHIQYLLISYYCSSDFSDFFCFEVHNKDNFDRFKHFKSIGLYYKITNMHEEIFDPPLKIWNYRH